MDRNPYLLNHIIQIIKCHSSNLILSNHTNTQRNNTTRIRRNIAAEMCCVHCVLMVIANDKPHTNLAIRQGD